MGMPDEVTVHGTILKADGTPEVGSVKFGRSVILRASGDDDTLIMPGTITAVLDELGSFSVLLYVTDDPAWTPQDWTYQVTMLLSQSRPRAFSFPLPSGDADVEFGDLMQVDASTGEAYAPLVHEHDGYVTPEDLEDLVSTGDLAGYATDAELATVAGVADAAITPGELTSALAAYATIAMLAGYVTNGGLTTTLTNYALASAVTSSLALKADKVITDGTFVVEKGNGTSALRMRSTGGAVDYDYYGNIVFSAFATYAAGGTFSGAQTGALRLRGGGGTTLAGTTNFGTTVNDAQSSVVPGVEAIFGGKNNADAMKFCGFQDIAGAPTGYHDVGDFVATQTGWYRCTVAGDPGTMVKLV